MLTTELSDEAKNSSHPINNKLNRKEWNEKYKKC